MSHGVQTRGSVAASEGHSGVETSSKRRRTKPARMEFDAIENEEQRMLQQALLNSRRDTKREEIPILEAPTYHPTIEEFKDPMKYIQMIHSEASHYGICKIVPPVGWNPPNMIDFNDVRLLPTRLQEIHTLQEGHTFEDGRKYTIKGYKEMAEAFENRWKLTHHPPSGSPSLAQLEKDYWDLVETAGLGREKVEVEYANDVDTALYKSGFPLRRPGECLLGRVGVEVGDGDGTTDRVDMFSDEYYRRCGWNLNNIPTIQGSLLKYVEVPITGVTVPWLYVGMLFTSFCWHAEDNYFMSVNYSHFGAPKQWYGVPGRGAKFFEQAAKELIPEAFRESPDLLHHMTTQISPNVLMKRNVPVYRLSQDPKTFVITFPQAFHAGFNYGFNCNEAVNFATTDWLPFGATSSENYRQLGKDSVISHSRLLMTLVHHLDSLPRVVVPEVAKQLSLTVEEELSSRMHLEKEHTRVIPVPKNNFACIDKMASDYDEKRECDICKHVCVLSAYACSCSTKRVACLRHLERLCRCPSPQKYLLAWITIPELKELQKKANYLRLTFATGSGTASSSGSVSGCVEGSPLDDKALVQLAKSDLF